MNILFRILLLLVVITLTACATHAPMSEMVMFTPKVVEHPSREAGLYYSRYSFAVSLEKSVFNYDQLRDYSEREYGNREVETIGYIPTIALNSILMSAGNDAIALNLATGPVFGLDATLRLTEKEYLTVGHTVFGGQQLILQRKILNTQNEGAALGIFYEHKLQAKLEECYSTICFVPSDDDFFNLNVFGIRGFWMGSNGRKNRAFFKATGKVGYINEYQDIYATIGFSAGIF